MIHLFKLASLGFLLMTNPLMAAQQAGQVQQGAKSQTAQVFGGPIVPTPWFSNQNVRGQLRLSDAQLSQLNKAYGGAYVRYQQAAKNLDKTLPPDQRSQKMLELQHRFFNDFGAPTNNILTDPQMRTRFSQLGLQYRGHAAFLDPTVQQMLNLTPAQQQKIQQLNQQWTKSMNDLGRDFPKDQQGATARFNELRQQEIQRMNGVLTGQQLQAWRQMTGASFNFPPQVYFQPSAPNPGQ